MPGVRPVLLHKLLLSVQPQCFSAQGQLRFGGWLERLESEGQNKFSEDKQTELWGFASTGFVPSLVSEWGLSEHGLYCCTGSSYLGKQ